MLQPLVKGILRKAARHSRSKPFAMRNTAPLVSFTFDDVPDSAFTNGAAILEQHGVRGTFYVAAGILGQMDKDWRVIDREQVGALYHRGHEIGCHTFSHVGVDTLDARMLDEECRHNREVLREICPVSTSPTFVIRSAASRCRANFSSTIASTAAAEFTRASMPASSISRCSG
jgi:peptidoglycan/xylan/chitin deacetylase (PgdA/CDA1 family)